MGELSPKSRLQLCEAAAIPGPSKFSKISWYPPSNVTKAEAVAAPVVCELEMAALPHALR